MYSVFGPASSPSRRGIGSSRSTTIRCDITDFEFVVDEIDARRTSRRELLDRRIGQAPPASANESRWKIPVAS
jgi:hypothetical protein